ncbi:MAG: acetolactate synthase small subunit [Armatimonadetes bacterium]|nr:acetolactate synthase small subunit [Armatimonadota bacterium]
MATEAIQPAAAPARRLLSVLVDNNPGVLMRIAALFRRRSINIHSLAVSTTEDPRVSRISMTVETDATETNMVLMQLGKLVEVRHAHDLSEQRPVERELALIKVTAGRDAHEEILEAGRAHRAHALDFTESTVTLEVSGRSAEIDALIEALADFGIQEIARTGAVALIRGTRAT